MRSAVAAFPDLKITIQDQIAEGDKVMSRLSTTGTHKGDFQGIPATGNSVHMEGWTLDRIVDGKIVEHRTIDDVMTMMRQLDLMPGG
jgi:predicted ester cyclase